MTKQTGELTELKGVITEGVRLGVCFSPCPMSCILRPVVRLMGQLTRFSGCVCVCVVRLFGCLVGLCVVVRVKVTLGWATAVPFSTVLFSVLAGTD